MLMNGKGLNNDGLRKVTELTLELQTFVSENPEPVEKVLNIISTDGH